MIDAGFRSRRVVLRFSVVACCLSAATAARGDIDPAALRGRYVLPQEPAGVATLADAKQRLGTTPQAVVIAGRIGGRGLRQGQGLVLAARDPRRPRPEART
jgi:hypothetical protein